MSLISPYALNSHRQYKGNLHTHTTNSDGVMTPQQVVDLYAALGYHFLMLSDHDHVTDIHALNHRGMALIPGYEITAGGGHLLYVGGREVLPHNGDRQSVIHAVNDRGGFIIVNHPNWEEDYSHWPQAELNRLQGFHGLEIYNGVSERAEGAALATDRWDMLLSKGRQVWGFGNDDTHETYDSCITWNMVFAEEFSMESLIAALRTGNFYVSTGVHIDAIHVEGNFIRIVSRDTQCFRVIRDHGMILAALDGPEMCYEVPDVAPLSYLRVECYGRGADMAWTQPFRIA